MLSSLIRSMNRNSSSSSSIDPTIFKEGDMVMLYRPKVSVTDSSNKLAVHWFGPYTVDKVASKGKVYYLKDYLGDPLKYPVSINLLKPYHHREGEELQYIPFPDSLLSDSEEHEYVPSKR